MLTLITKTTQGALVLLVCPARVKGAWWVSWCTPAGKKTSIDSLSYGNGRSEFYPNRYNYNWILVMRNG